MKSATLSSFWLEYAKLDQGTRESARKAYRLWRENPYHPSLRFKCINREESLWAVRITRACRAIGSLEGNQVTWFWIGWHDKYEQFFV